MKKSESPVESPSSCTEVHYCYNSTGPVSTDKERGNGQHPSPASLDALERRTPQVAVLTVVLLKETPVSEYREQFRRNKGRGGKEDKFLLCHSGEDTTLHNGGIILPQITGEGKEISAEHLCTRFGWVITFKQ